MKVCFCIRSCNCDSFWKNWLRPFQSKLKVELLKTRQLTIFAFGLSFVW